MKDFLTCLAAMAYLGVVIYIVDRPARMRRKETREVFAELKGILHG